MISIGVHDQAIAWRHDDGFFDVLAVVLNLIEPHATEIDVSTNPEAANRRKLPALDRLTETEAVRTLPKDVKDRLAVGIILDAEANGTRGLALR